MKIAVWSCVLYHTVTGYNYLH